MKKIATLALTLGFALTGCANHDHPELVEAYDYCGEPAFATIDGTAVTLPINNGTEGVDGVACMADRLGMKSEHFDSVLTAYDSGRDPFGHMGNGHTLDGTPVTYTYVEADRGEAILIEVIK